MLTDGGTETRRAYGSPQGGLTSGCDSEDYINEDAHDMAVVDMY